MKRSPCELKNCTNSLSAIVKRGEQYTAASVSWLPVFSCIFIDLACRKFVMIVVLNTASD